MRHHLIAHHKSMHEMHKRHADSLDDGHEMKAFHIESASHHAKLCKALEPASNDPAQPSVGSEDWRGRGGDLDGPKAFGADDLAKMFEL